MKSNQIVVSILTCVLLTACGTRNARPTPEVVTPVETVVVPAPQPTIEPEVDIATTATRSTEQAAVTSLPAAIALRDQAAIATSARDHSRAIGLLERALRISPSDPQTFHDLAANHLALQQPQQALQLARRGLTLSPTPAQRDALQNLITRSESRL